MRCVLGILPLVLLVLLFAGCPRPAGGQVRPEDEGAEAPTQPRFTAQPDERADEALKAAVQTADTQPAPRGIAALLEVRKAYPQSTAGQEALYRAGMLQYEAKDYAGARKSLNELLFENPLFDKADSAKLRLGLSALEVRAYRDAYQTLASVAERTQGGAQREALTGAIRAAEGAQLQGEVLRMALRLADSAETPEERKAADQRVSELVEGKVGFLEIARVKQGLSPSHPAWPVLTFKLARIYYHLRDWQRLDETLKELVAEAPSSPFATEARDMLARTARRTGSVRPKVIGVLLPLSGKFKPVGDAVLRGIQLALKGSDVEVVVKDTQGDVNLTGKMAEELVFDDGAIAIIGPLHNDDSRRAALVAEELQIPIITLTRGENITAIGPHVFRNMLTNQQQARGLADYATGTLGYKTFAVLYPNLPFGVELANGFWDEVSARGGQLRGAETYDHDQTTFTGEVKKLVGRYYLEDRADFIEKMREVRDKESDPYRKRKMMERVKSTLEPVVDFEALLIPDSWQRVGLVAPALAVEDIITNACDAKDIEKIKKTTGRKELKTVTLLGTNTWSSPKGRSGVPELLERGGKFVYCSVYVDGFFADSSRRATRKFVTSFNDTYKEAQPTLFDAVGYDSAAMIRHIADTAAPRTREAMTLQLASLKNFDGATGMTSFDDHREAVKPLFFLTIDKNGVKELDAKSRGGS